MAIPETMTVEVPATLASKLATANQNLINDLLRRGIRDLSIEQALDGYQLGNISFAAAAEQADVSLAELARYAYIRNIEPPFSEDMVAEELN